MAVKIGHASIDENGKTVGSSATLADKLDKERILSVFGK